MERVIRNDENIEESPERVLTSEECLKLFENPKYHFSEAHEIDKDYQTLFDFFENRRLDKIFSKNTRVIAVCPCTVSIHHVLQIMIDSQLPYLYITDEFHRPFTFITRSTDFVRILLHLYLHCTPIKNEETGEMEYKKKPPSIRAWFEREIKIYQNHRQWYHRRGRADHEDHHHHHHHHHHNRSSSGSRYQEESDDESYNEEEEVYDDSSNDDDVDDDVDDDDVDVEDVGHSDTAGEEYENESDEYSTQSDVYTEEEREHSKNPREYQEDEDQEDVDEDEDELSTLSSGAKSEPNHLSPIYVNDTSSSVLLTGTGGKFYVSPRHARSDPNSPINFPKKEPQHQHTQFHNQGKRRRRTKEQTQNPQQQQKEKVLDDDDAEEEEKEEGDYEEEDYDGDDDDDDEPEEEEEENDDESSVSLADEIEYTELSGENTDFFYHISLANQNTLVPYMKDAPGPSGEKQNRGKYKKTISTTTEASLMDCVILLSRFNIHHLMIFPPQPSKEDIQKFMLNKEDSKENLIVFGEEVCKLYDEKLLHGRKSLYMPEYWMIYKDSDILSDLVKFLQLSPPKKKKKVKDERKEKKENDDNKEEEEEEEGRRKMKNMKEREEDFINDMKLKGKMDLLTLNSSDEEDVFERLKAFNISDSIFQKPIGDLKIIRSCYEERNTENSKERIEQRFFCKRESDLLKVLDRMNNYGCCSIIPIVDDKGYVLDALTIADLVIFLRGLHLKHSKKNEKRGGGRGEKNEKEKKRNDGDHHHDPSSSYVYDLRGVTVQDVLTSRLGWLKSLDDIRPKSIREQHPEIPRIDFEPIIPLHDTIVEGNKPRYRLMGEKPEILFVNDPKSLPGKTYQNDLIGNKINNEIQNVRINTIRFFCKENEKFESVLRHLSDTHIHHLICTDENGKLRGIVGSSDVLFYLTSEYQEHFSLEDEEEEDEEEENRKEIELIEEETKNNEAGGEKEQN